MKALALALALAADPGARTTLPPAPVRLYRIAWQRAFVAPEALEWKPIESGGVAVDPATGLALFGTRDGWFHAVRPDGSVAWEVQVEASAGPPAVDGDTVYVGTSGGRLYALAIAGGKTRWRYDANEDLSTRPAVASGSVFVASLQDTVFCIDAATGKWKWHHRREQKGEGFTIFGAASAAVGPDVVYGAYSDGFVAALDPATGAARWERRVAPLDDHLDVDAIALDGGRLYAAAYSGAVVALDARTGDAVWTFKAPGAARVIVAPGVVVAVTSGNVYALSPGDGSAVWTTALGGAPAGAPSVAGKWLLVPAGPGGLRWIEVASGRTLRVFDPGPGVSATPAAAKGRVYVLSNGGDLYALDVS